MGAIMEKGELVPLQMVLYLLRDVIQKQCDSGEVSGILIDGCPRQKEQGVLFEKQISPVTAIIYFQASDQILTERMLERGKTSGRSDDNQATIKKRLETFKHYNEGVLKLFKNKVTVVNAERTIDEVFADVVRHIDPLVRKQGCACKS